MIHRITFLRAITAPLLLAGLMLLQIGASKRADISASVAPASVGAGQSATLSVTVMVEPGYHAQSHTPLDQYLIPLTVTVEANPAFTAGSVQYPPGDIETFPALGKVSVYTGAVVVNVPITVAASAAGMLHVGGKVHLQICNDKACYPPQTLPFSADLNVSGTTTAPTTAPTTNPAPAAATAPPPSAAGGVDVDHQSAVIDLSTSPNVFGRQLGKDAYLLAFAAAFVVGIIFNAMPCVLPVVPLKLMGFYEVSQHNRRKSVWLGAVFSAGVIFSFAVLALLIVVLHVIDWGGLFKLTWFTVLIVAVLLIMAAQTFGFFEVALPVGVYSWAPRHDTVSGNFLFGILTAALSTPCTFGIFATLLVWALSQPPWVGSALLIVVGIGMAFPYFVLSGFPEVARSFPRTGPVSLIIKQMMGFLLLGAAIYFAQPLFRRFLSQDVFWWTLFAVLAGGMVFFFVRVAMVSWPRWPVVVAGIVAIGTILPTFIATMRLASNPYRWTPYTPAALSSATGAGRPVLIDFTATWCGNCHFIEGFVLHDPKIVSAVRNDDVLMLQADVTDADAIGQPLLDKLDSSHAIPLTAVYPAHGGPAIKLSGIYSVDDLLHVLQQAR